MIFSAIFLSLAFPLRSQRAILATALFIAAACVGPKASAEAPKADIRPALWTVSDADTTLYLFGSVHLLRPEDKWRFPAFRRAMAQSDAIYLEAPSDRRSQASLALLVARHGLNPPGRTLSSLLTAENRARLEKISSLLGLPAGSLEPARPWFAFVSLSAKAAERFGASPVHGVDAVLEAQARRIGKEIRFFETLEQQIRIFAELSPEDETAVLEMALKDLDEDPDQFQKLLEAWKSGDLAALEKLSLDPLRAGPKAFFDGIFTERNKAWAAELDRVMARESGVKLVVVGAAHLVGEGSVQQLLKEKGYFVARR